ncbi:MAG: tripartite tricarboxylate transporter substrate binding protein [Alphaproteobacteria bacterium]|nr:tripartite tricarboxylate transporter substrate binding protein [Alphaproteobacteria bacterium]
MSGLSRRTFLAGAAALAAVPAFAQDYPQRPVRLIVPYAAGGGTDVFSRLLTTRIEKEFGQTFVIDNRAGGASVIGTRAVAEAAPDGYTVGMMDSAFFTNPGLLKDKLPYDTRKDFITVSLLSRTQLVLSVHPSSPFKTAQELVAHAKKNPGKLTFASAGIGTGIHLAGEQFRQVAGIDVVIVPYRGGAPMLQDFLAGKTDFTFGAVPTIKPHIEAGKVRGLGVTRGRAPQLPGIPSMEEIGFGSVDSASEMGLIVPKGTPAPVVEKLQRITASAVKDPAFREALLQRGFQPIGTTSEEYRAHVDREIEKWIRIIEKGNVKAE